MTTNNSRLPLKHEDGRYMYDEKRLLYLLKRMSAKKELRVLRKAIKIIDEQKTTGINAIALALGCGYDDAGFWWSEKKIRV